MSFANKLLRVIHRIALFIARKLLKFLLPIPFFPNTSIVLAVYVGFTPVNLNPASPPVRLYPRLPASLCEIISKIVGTPHTQVQPDYATENSMDLSEKISTWRQRDLEAARLEAGEIDGSRRHPLAKPQPPKHTRIEQVDFEMPIQGIDKMTEESVQDLEHLRLPPPFFPTEDQPAGSNTVPPSEPKDADYARLSAEKDIYEKSYKEEGSKQLQTALIQLPYPPTPPPKYSSLDSLKSPRSPGSEASSVILAPAFGEVSTVPAPSDKLKSSGVEPYNSLKDMHIFGSRSVKSKKDAETLKRFGLGETKPEEDDLELEDFFNFPSFQPEV